MTTQLTPKQLTILLCIRAGAHSTRTLSRAMGRKLYSGKFIYEPLKALRKKNLVTWGTEEKGTLRLTEAGHRATAGYLLTRKGEQVTGVWQIDRIATAHYASPLPERESVYCSIEEFEAMQE